MPVPVPLSSFQYVPVTKENLDWADIPTVDLSKIKTPEGKKEQSQILINAVREYGFFYVIVSRKASFTVRKVLKRVANTSGV